METAETIFPVSKYAVVILAAGDSSRLGEAKQLLTFRNKTLLQHAIDAAKETSASRIVVVLGSRKDIITKEIDQDGILIVENSNWQSGLASSIITGIKAVKNTSENIDAILLMVCDQPFADSEILHKIIENQRQSGKGIVGCSYDDTKGIPALFHRKLFPELLMLEGDHGAKKLFDKYNHFATFVPFKDGGIDIDTSVDYKNLPK